MFYSHAVLFFTGHISENSFAVKQQSSADSQG